MDTATIKFSHLQAELPKCIFSDRVAITIDYQPNDALVPESWISTVQSQWETNADAKICPHCNGCFVDSRTKLPVYPKL